MARSPKPWFDNERDCWKVTISGKRFNLGRDKKTAFKAFYRLMNQPIECRKVDSRFPPAVIDAFLDWTQKHRAPDTYEWYRYGFQRFVETYPALIQHVTVKQSRVGRTVKHAHIFAMG